MIWVKIIKLVTSAVIYISRYQSVQFWSTEPLEQWVMESWNNEPSEQMHAPLCLSAVWWWAGSVQGIYQRFLAENRCLRLLESRLMRCGETKPRH